MRNFIQNGDIITVAAPAAVASGDGVLVGTLFGIAVDDADSGA
jgi:predicted RecA/RadA family phage recombinase